MKHLASFSLFVKPDGSFQVTVDHAKGIREMLPHRDPDDEAMRQLRRALQPVEILPSHDPAEYVDPFYETSSDERETMNFDTDNFGVAIADNIDPTSFYERDYNRANSITATALPNDGKRHVVRQESDEFACSCGKRWDVSEGMDHP